MPDQNPKEGFENKGNFNFSNPLSSQSSGNDNVEIKSKPGNTAGTTSDADEVMQKNLKIDKKISNDQQNATPASESKPDNDQKPASRSKSDSQSKATQKQDSEPAETPEKKADNQPAEQKSEQEPTRQPEQPEDQQAEEEQQDDNGPDRPDKKEEPEEQAEEEPAKEEPTEEQPAEEQPETEAQTEEGAAEEPASEATDAAGKSGEDLSAEGTDAAGGGGEGLATDAVDAAGGTGEGLSTGAVDAAGGTGEALTTATPAAGAAGTGEAAVATAEAAAVTTAEVEAAGAGTAAGGWIPVVIILAILFLIVIVLVVIGFVKSKTTTNKNDPTQAEQITIMQDNIASGGIIFDDPASKTLIDEGNVGFQALSTMNHLAERHKPLKIHFAGAGSTGTTKQNEAYEFDVLEVDMIKCTNTSTNAKALEVPIVLDVNFNWSSILSGNDPNLLCAGGYYPGIETPSQGKYSTTFNPGEFKLSTIAQSGPALAQEKTAEIIDETVLQNEQEGISAQSDKSLLPKTILLNSKYAQTNISTGTNGVSATLQTIIERNYTDITLGRGITSDDTITGLHIAFD